jgi:phage baseplate assembly protein V
LPVAIMIERRDAKITDLERRVSNGVIIGVISQVDHAMARYRVKAGDLETDWIPDTQARAGKTRTYEGRDVGEQVVVVSPSGDLSQGVIVGSIHTEERQAGDKGSTHRTIYPDGTTIDYDDEAKAYKVAIADGGSFALAIGGGVSLEASGGKLSVKAPGGIDFESPTLTSNGKDISDQHKHTGVTPGASDTGPPA